MNITITAENPTGMKVLVLNTLKSDWPFVIFVCLVSLAYLAGIPGVPFHPDEATQIFMSADFDILLEQPDALAWQPGSVDEPLRQQYRLLDAPLTRYLIGAGRRLSGNVPALISDWDWSKTWQENEQAGALPSQPLLFVGRLSVAWLFPFCLVAIYLTGRTLGGTTAGWAAAVLLAGNALVLLHTRRAMAESGLLAGVVFFLFALVHLKQRTWLLAIPTALAFCAKQLGAPIAAAGLAAAWFVAPKPLRNRNTSVYLILLAFLLIVLHPFVWKDPLGGLQAALLAREDLVERQTQTLAQVSPDHVLSTLPQRFMGLLAHLFVLEPAPADVGNYAQQTQSAENTYFNNPLHTLMRGWIWGGVLMFTSAFGLLTALLDARPKSVTSPIKKQHLRLICLTTALQALALLSFISIPFQRYYLSLVPFVCLWSGYGLARLIELAGSLRPTRRQAPETPI